MTSYQISTRHGIYGGTGVASVIALSDPRDTLSALRETLCVAQSAMLSMNTVPIAGVERIGRIVTEIDRQRPLGPDGKHGNLHTATCGCTDIEREQQS